MGKYYLIFLLLWCIGSSLRAQMTTSGINGKVTADGDVLIGASVQAIHEASGTIYGTTTNMEGQYSLQGLRTGGPYLVEVSYVGFQKAVFKNITLQLGENYLLNVALTESATLDEVFITASKSALFNSQKTGAAQNFNQSQIQAIPSIKRSIFDITRLNPMAINTSGGMSFVGSSNKYNSFLIDGTANNDIFGLAPSGTNGGQAGANPISLDAIEEIQVVIAPFDVRQSGFTGGGINAITRSGTNTFHGSAYGYFNNEKFYGKTPGDTDDRKRLSDLSTETYGVTLGGPIIKNKLFFFTNFERVKETKPSTNTIGSSASNVTADEANAVINKISELTGGYNGGGYAPLDIDTYSNKFLARLDWNINQRNKFTIRYSLLDARSMVFSNNMSAAHLNDNGYYMNNSTHSLVAELNSQISSDWTNEFRAGWTRVRDSRDPIGRPMPYVKILNLSKGASLEFGSESNSTANSLGQDIYTLVDNVSWNKGNHFFTFGTYNEFFHFTNLYIANNYGAYTYNSLDDFLSVGTANEAMPSFYSYAYSRKDVTGTTRWTPTFGAAQLGFYAQDDWKLTDRFRLTYGLRIDIPLFFDKPRANEEFNQSDIAREYGIATQQLPSAKVLWSPRAGFRWNLDEEGMTLLRGGLGLFTGRVPFVWIANGFSNTGVEMGKTSLSSAADFEKAKADGFKFNADPAHQYPYPDDRNLETKAITSEVDVADKKFKYPSVFRINLALEHTFPFDIKGSVEGLYSKTLNNIWYENLNYRQAGTLGNGGDDRPVYQKQSNKYTQIMYLTNTNKGYSYNITAKLEKAFDFGLSAMVAYTYGQSKSLTDGNSSQAYSGWKFNPTYYGDANPELTWSMFDVRNRIVGIVSYTKDYAKHFGTTVSLVYNGQTGGRYSLLYNNDLNGDGWSNDLLYIPTDAERNQMVFVDNYDKGQLKATAAEQKAAFANWIDGNKELSKSKGEHLKRNQMVMPFEHHFDFHIAQNFYMNVAGRRHTLQVNFDILNVGNLFNKKWGLYNKTTTGYDLAPVVATVASGQATYKFIDPGKMVTAIDLDSRWHAQVGVRYIF